MSRETKYKCDVCGKEIKEGHQLCYMVTITVNWVEMVADGGIGTEDRKNVYHVHNDLSNHCMRKLWEILGYEKVVGDIRMKQRKEIEENETNTPEQN